MDDWRELYKKIKNKIKGVSILHEHAKFLRDCAKWTKEIVFATAWKSVSHEHANFHTTIPNTPKWC